MTENLVLLVVSIVPWFLLTFLAMVKNYFEKTENSKSVSLLPTFVMPIIMFVIGFTINHFFANVGTWLIGIFAGVFIIWGAIDEYKDYKTK